jgi:hypothetical protein
MLNVFSIQTFDVRTGQNKSAKAEAGITCFALRTLPFALVPHSLAASLGRLKGADVSSTTGGLTGFAPFRTMLDDPIRQRAFEADIAAGFFGFKPFVFQNLFALRLKFPVKRRILE